MRINDYASVDKTDELSDLIDDVEDVMRLGPWTLHRKKDTKIAFTANNFKHSEGKRMPLMIEIKEDKKVSLYTTPYDAPTFEESDAGGFNSVAHKNFSRDESAYEWFCNNFRGEFPSFSFDGSGKIKYLSKDDVLGIILESNGELDSIRESSLPLLAFDNNEDMKECEECDIESKRVFQFHLSDSAGFDFVIYEWNLELKQLYVIGEYCPRCTSGLIELYENDLDGESEVIYDN